MRVGASTEDLLVKHLNLRAAGSGAPGTEGARSNTQAYGTQVYATHGYSAQLHPTQSHGTQLHGTQLHGTQLHGTQLHGTQSHPTQSHPTQSHAAQLYPNQPHQTHVQQAQPYNQAPYNHPGVQTGRSTPASADDRATTRRPEVQSTGPVSWGQVGRFGAARGDQPRHEDNVDNAHHIALVLCTAGSARYQCANQIHHVRPATISWSVPALRSEFVDASAEYEAWVAQVSGSLVQRMGLMGQQRQGAALSRRLTSDSAKRLESHFEYLASLPSNSDQFHVGMEYLLLSAWAEQHRTTRVDELIDIHPAVEKAAHILRHQPETSSLRELAQACNASPSWLSRLFREQLGVSLVGYRNQARIERFFELYGAGHGANLTEAALGAGFGSYAQFHRVFKDTLGFAPGDLKRGVRGAVDSIRP
jgi:AraC-like DNA-binding protein